MKILGIAAILLLGGTIYGQVGIGTTTPDPSSILDITSSNTGVLLPRMLQSERDAIPTPAVGLLIYQTDGSPGFYAYNGSSWTALASSGTHGEFQSILGVVLNTTAIATDDFLFGSSQLNDNTLGTTDNARLFFDKSKGAFRAGEVSSTHWDQTNVGTGSFAAGNNTTASGASSTALGSGSSASGSNSTAMGNSTSASGVFSSAFGNATRATGFGATSLGVLTTASGDVSLASGSQTNASGSFSTALGFATRASGISSTALGNVTTASGASSTALGSVTDAPSFAEVAIGLNSETYTPTSTDSYSANDRIFSIGNGSSLLAPSNALTVLKNGNIGIGTSTPTQGKLVVSGGANTNNGSFAFYAQNGGVPFSGSGSGSGNFSIYASNRIGASEFNAFSDERIKVISGISDGQEDLKTLSKIEITNYRLKDEKTAANKTYKKVIAQQVKEVYPRAVSSNIKEVIPNIYSISEINDGWIQLVSSEVKKGDRVKLIFSTSEVLVEVLAVSEGKIKVDTEKEGTVFVYGTLVNDFHTVDYEAISMLNVSATQALLKRIEALEKDNAQFRQDYQGLESRLEAIEGLLTPFLSSSKKVPVRKNELYP
ncbi:MAG: tail fiber domain-containing protein [Bacteroidota bacterium]